jgi:NhaA family Na+:H+ antiporter
MLGGIGFTMSIFIANLAFRNEVFLTEAKLAVLVTSAMAGTVAYVYLRAIARDGRPA